MSAKPEFTTRVAESDADVEACKAIRIEVFIDEQGFSIEDEIDQYDVPGASISFLVCTGSTPVGTIRLVTAKAKLTRLAVLKAYRSYGLGRVLVRALEDYVASHPERKEIAPLVKDVEGGRVVSIKCHSQMPVVPFYAKLGYVPVGDEFDEDGAPHQLVVHDIPVTV